MNGTLSASRRLARGILANLLNIVTRVAVQFAALPIFFASWPGDRIGSWMVAFAIPSYIALLGNGFAGAGGSAALAAARSGDMDRARADFRIACGLSLIGTALFAVAFVAGAQWIARLAENALSGISAEELGPAFLWLAIYIFASSQMSLMEIAFRVAGRYPDSILLNSLSQLAEIVVIALCVTQSNSVADLAMGLALMRAGFAVLTLAIALRIMPTLFARRAAPLGPSLVDLWKPSVAFMMMPLVFGFNLQGYLLLVGAWFGPVMLAGFVATRTLTRLLDLVTSVIYGVQYFEAGYQDDDNVDLLRRQMATMTMIALLLALGIGAVLLIAGPWLQSLYTLGQTRFDVAVAFVLLAAATVRTLASSPASLIAAANRHGAIIAGYFAGSALSLALAVGMAWAGLPLPLVLSTLVLAELSQTIPLFLTVLHRLELSPAAFLRLVLSRDRLADIAAAIRHLRQGS